MSETTNVPAPNYLNLPWPEISSFDAKDCAAIIPVGQIVQHGPHLPVGTDVFQAEGVTASIASEMCRRGFKAIIGPTISFGHSPTQESHPGYVNLRPEVLSDQIEDVASCLARQGLRKQAYLMFGPGSWWPLYVVSTRLARSGTANIIIIDGLLLARTVGMNLLVGHDPGTGKFDVHAGELETSLMLAIRPELVQMDKAVSHFSGIHAAFAACACTKGPLLQQMAAAGMREWKAFGEDGVTGDATLATAEKGRQIISRAVKELAEHFSTHLFTASEAIEKRST
jgi:creatinine amidohydrolase